MIKLIYTLLFLLVFGTSITNVLAQASPSALYVPLIGITSVPQPLALPNGPGIVTYNFAVKNFLREVGLSDVKVVDDKCSPVVFVEGDDNGDSKLDYDETWRYSCTIKLSESTNSTATATGIASGINASDKAYDTVLVGSDDPPPLVSIINVTKVAFPLSLPEEGGKITFTYKVNNPGEVPLRQVTVTDNKCSDMSGKLGDTNGNNLLDVREVWIYTCAATLTETTTNTVTVNAFANGLKASDNYTVTVNVNGAADQSVPNLPDTGLSANLKIFVWTVLSGILVLFMIFYGLTRKENLKKR